MHKNARKLPFAADVLPFTVRIVSFTCQDTPFAGFKTVYYDNVCPVQKVINAASTTNHVT